jgi:hypothetical protein
MAFHLYNSRYPGRPVHSSRMFELFSLDATAKWPDAGLPPRELPATDTSNGTAVDVTVWVRPITRTPGRKSSAHRVRCLCPGCNVELSAGRLFQHVCSTTLTDNQLRYRKLLLQLMGVCKDNPFVDSSGCADVAWALREFCFPQGMDDSGGDFDGQAEAIEQELLS